MPSDCNGVYIMFLTDFWKKNLECTSEFWVFSLFCDFSTFLTVLWLLIFVSAEPSRTILSIDGSEPRFQHCTGGEIRKTLKNDENFDVFC